MIGLVTAVLAGSAGGLPTAVLSDHLLLAAIIADVLVAAAVFPALIPHPSLNLAAGGGAIARRRVSGDDPAGAPRACTESALPAARWRAPKLNVRVTRNCASNTPCIAWFRPAGMWPVPLQEGSRQRSRRQPLPQVDQHTDVDRPRAHVSRRPDRSIQARITTPRYQSHVPPAAYRIGVMPTSALRRLCRPRGYADVGIGSRARCGLPCESGRHNPDVITVLASRHCRDRPRATPTVGTSKESRRNSLQARPSVPPGGWTVRPTHAAAVGEGLVLRDVPGRG
jgi:hypothetical protein